MIFFLHCRAFAAQGRSNRGTTLSPTAREQLCRKSSLRIKCSGDQVGGKPMTDDNELPPDQLCRQLLDENAMLRRLLSEHHIAIRSPELPPPTDPVPQPAPLEAEDPTERARRRIALFRSLFRGREDVFAARWESRSGDGKSGYMPAAERDWKAISRTKSEDRKKVDQQTRRLLPLTDKVIEDHLWGRHTIGVSKRSRRIGTVSFLQRRACLDLLRSCHLRDDAQKNHRKRAGRP